MLPLAGLVWSRGGFGATPLRMGDFGGSGSIWGVGWYVLVSVRRQKNA